MKKNYKILCFCLISFCFISCKPVDMKGFYEENSIESSKINSIKIFGEENILKISKNILPFEIQESFADIYKYYSHDNSENDISFIDIYYSKINKGYYSGISSSVMYKDRLYLFTKKQMKNKKGNVHFIFLSKTNEVFNIFEIEFKPITEDRFNDIMDVITENHEIDF